MVGKLRNGGCGKKHLNEMLNCDEFKKVETKNMNFTLKCTFYET